MIRLAITLLICLLLAHSASAQEWLAAPSTFTHDPRTAERVNQYTPIGPVYAFPDPTIQSGYRHVRSVIRAGDSADYLHVVEQWGQTPVRPYGEWQFPYRPYSVPYDLWGPPYVAPYAFPPSPFPPYQPFPPYPPFPSYPSYPFNAPSSDYPFPGQ